jgi:SpoVK/Ycf46/Vps4 family AAA+-type ATPase
MALKNKNEQGEPSVGYELVNLAKGYAKINWVVTSRSAEFILDLRSALTFVENNSPDSANHEKQIHIYDTVSNYQNITKYEAMWTNQAGFEQVPTVPVPFRTIFRQFVKDAPAYSTLIVKDAFNIKSVEDWRFMLNSQRLLYASAKRVFLLGATDNLPAEYKRDLNLFYHSLPTVEQREAMIRETIKETNTKLDKVLGAKAIKFDLSDSKLINQLVQITAGLTLGEIKNGIFRSVQDIRTKYSVNVDLIIKHKKECLEKVTKIEFLESNLKFGDIGGLENLKQYCLNRHKPENENLPKSGIILIGPPGVAKTTFANALGNELGVPTMVLDFSAIFNRLIGESEKAMKAAIDTFETLDAGVLVLDEIDKSLGGVASSNRTDGGTTSRVFELLLKWLSDSKRKIYVVATSNSIDDLPPEFSRAGRWDNVFFIDFPTEEECKAIFQKKCEIFEVKNWEKEYAKVSLKNMTGAEIQSLIVEYKFSGDWDVAKQMVPMVYNTQGPKIEKLRREIGSKYVSAAKISTGKSKGLSIDSSGNLK